MHNISHQAKRTAALAILLQMITFTANAETSTDTVDVFAGLTSTLTLGCPNINFGFWRIPTGNRGGSTTIELKANGETEVTGDGSARVSRSLNFSAPYVSMCASNHSTAAAGTEGLATFPNGNTGSLMPVTNRFAGWFGEDVPNPVEELDGFSYTLNFTTTKPITGSGGSAIWYIVGSIEIPDNIEADNYGGYESAPITVMFEDNAPSNE